MASSGSFAYLATRRGHHTAEFGAHAYGPDAARLAEELAEQVRVWDRDHRGGPGPRITIHPITPRFTCRTGPHAGFYAAPHAGSVTGPRPLIGSAIRLAEGRLITKRHVHVAVSWPSPGLPAIGSRILRDPVGN